LTSCRTAARKARKICGSRETSCSTALDGHRGRALCDPGRRCSDASSRAEDSHTGAGDNARYRHGPREEPASRGRRSRSQDQGDLPPMLSNNLGGLRAIESSECTESGLVLQKSSTNCFDGTVSPCTQGGWGEVRSFRRSGKSAARRHAPSLNVQENDAYNNSGFSVI
jgi:hypothetical protein